MMREMKIVVFDRTNLKSPYTFEDDRDGPTLSRIKEVGWQYFETCDLVIFRNSLGRFFVMKTVKESFRSKWFSDEEYDRVIESIISWYDEKYRIKFAPTTQTRRIRATRPAEVEDEVATRIIEEVGRSISEIQPRLAEMFNNSNSPYESSNYASDASDATAELDVEEIERIDRLTTGLRERYAIQPIATTPNTTGLVYVNGMQSTQYPWSSEAAGFQRIPEIAIGGSNVRCTR
jgi:hypothetical protein